MTAMPIWMLPILYAVHLAQVCLPRRYAIPGTRIRYTFKHLADELLSDRREGFDPFQEGIGTVVEIEREYVGPEDRNKMAMGTYVANSKFPRGYIVKPDGGGDLVCVPIENAQLLSGYRYAIPALTEKSEGNCRIGDLPQELAAYPGDLVRLKGGTSDVERRVGRILFTSRGEPVYEVYLTKEEVVALNAERRRKAEARNRAWTVAEETETHSWVRKPQFVRVQKGNLFYLNNSYPEDLHFDSLKEECRFFARHACIWLSDENTYKGNRSYSREEAIVAIEKGEFELAFEMLDYFTPIQMMPRYEKFRARVRKAGLEYLRSL